MPRVVGSGDLPDGGDGIFEPLVVTEDDQHHAISASATAMTAITTLAAADTTLVWDPTNQTLIVANIVGTMPWTVRDSSSCTAAGGAARKVSRDPEDPSPWAHAVESIKVHVRSAAQMFMPTVVRRAAIRRAGCYAV